MLLQILFQECWIFIIWSVDTEMFTMGDIDVNHIITGDETRVDETSQQ